MFSLGRVVATPAAIAFMEDREVDPRIVLRRHLLGEWDEMDPGDAQMNRDAVESGEDRIFSSFNYNGNNLWIITEWDRSATTILMPEDY